MAIATITKVFEKNNAKNWPGSVTFSDGKKLSTFDDALIALALNAVGQLAEYEVEVSEGKNGKRYENLGALKLRGAVPSGGSNVQATVPSSPAPHSAAPAVDFGALIGAIRVASDNIVAAIRASGTRTFPVAGATGDPFVAPEPTAPAVDPYVEAEAKLAAALDSPEAARAMFNAMRKRHKDPEKLREAVATCLKDHGAE